MKLLLSLLVSVVWAQTPIDLSRPAETLPFSILADARVSHNETTVLVAPGRFPAVYVSNAASIQTRVGSLLAGARIWIEWDPISLNRVVVGNSQARLNLMQLTNIVAGSNDAVGFTSGRSPIAYCDGDADRWASCVDVRSPFAVPRINLGPGGQLTWSSDGAANLSCVPSGP